MGAAETSRLTFGCTADAETIKLSCCLPPRAKSSFLPGGGAVVQARPSENKGGMPAPRSEKTGKRHRSSTFASDSKEALAGPEGLRLWLPERSS